jgi:hypothetical protein
VGFDAYVWFDETRALPPTAIAAIAAMAYYQATQTSLDSANRFFELDNVQSDWLFMPGDKRSEDRPQGDASAWEVAAHIRKFVDAGGEPKGMREDIEDMENEEEEDNG